MFAGDEQTDRGFKAIAQGREGGGLRPGSYCTLKLAKRSSVNIEIGVASD